MERGLKTFSKLLIFTRYTTNHRGTLSKTNQSYMRQKWKLNNAPLKSHSCVPWNQRTDVSPPAQENRQFSFQVQLFPTFGRWKQCRAHTQRRNTQRAQFYNKNDVSITLTATIMMTVRIYIIMGEWFILISSLYTSLKTSVLKNGDCICNMWWL